MPYSAYAGALCLDGPTLTNLELLESSTGSSEGSLLSCLDSCASAGACSSQVLVPIQTLLLEVQVYMLLPRCHDHHEQAHRSRQQVPL